jgi:hypothetical protein
MKKIIPTLFLLMLVTLVFAQDGIGYFYDTSGQFYVFDKGNTYKLESGRVDSIKIGNDYLAYIDAQSNLKVYRNGETKILEKYPPNIVTATAYALVYKMEQRLMIYDRGNKQQLASWADHFFADDSIVVWQARPSLDIFAYWNGKITTIETATSTKVIKGGKTGRNVFAYSDLNNIFKVYYNGQVIETKAEDIRNYKCGVDIVAFVDRFNNTFNVFENGMIKTISSSLPQSYSVIGNVINYLDINNNFMVYYNGKSIQLESYESIVYPTKGNILVYYYKPQLKLFYEGKVFLLEKFIDQKELFTGINSVAYTDNSNRAKFFYNGKLYDNFLMNAPITIELYRDLPAFTYNNNTIGFLYNGKLYEYLTSSR